jgi:hypothetical protein
LRSEPIHYSIPVSDIPRNARFYTEVVGCRHLSRVPPGDTPFLDAVGTCLILVKRDPPINPVLNGPCAYFLDPDGTVLESFDLTSYACSPS